VLLGPLKSLSNPTPITKTIVASADIYMIERNLSPSKQAYIGYANRQFLEVGYDAVHQTPITSYIQFNLSSIQNPEWNFLTSVSYTAELKMLGVSTFPQNASSNTNYIITVARSDCNIPWKGTTPLWIPYNCPHYATDATTESSILILGKSIPNFYEWTVTSALEKVLQKNEVTFRLTGYALNANNFNGGVIFWSKRTADYLANFYAGPTDVLIVTTTTATSTLANLLIIVTAAVTAVAAIYPFIIKAREKKPSSG
jgi:hypothetical protein